MTQRNFQNARNQGDGPKGKSRKSASSAKIKSKAGSSVYTPSKNAKAKSAASSRKASAKTTDKKTDDSAEKLRRREQAMVSMMNQMPEYKHWRRIWWVLMGVAFFAVIATWVPNMLVSNGVLGADFAETSSWISVAGFVFALFALAAAFYIDLRKIRKIQKAQEAKARHLSKSEARELDRAIEASLERDRQKKAERKASRPWNKRKAQKEAEADADESATEK